MRRQLEIKVLAVAFLGLTLALGACHKKPSVKVTPPPPPPVIIPEPPPEPEPTLPPIPTPPPVNYFAQGEEYFENGDYPHAVGSYEKFLGGDSTEKNHDYALFRLAIIYTLPGSPLRDLPKGIGLLKRMVTLFPESPLRAQAQLILDLQAEVDRMKGEAKEKDERLRDRNERIRDQEERIKRLTSELEKLKKIDMDRRPSRPPQ
jgi:tetratricopeptide (TPR) repeat protein